MYESKHQPVLSRERFYRRVAAHLAATFLFLGFSLALGMAGYATTESLSLVDSFLNAAMLLGGMGPVNPPLTTSGKIFAGSYALYSGLVFLLSCAIILTPVLHRVLHNFHMEPTDPDARRQRR